MATTNEASFWDFKGIDEYNDSKFLIRTPYPIALILVCYLWFVLKIGPDYMKNRPPLKVRGLLVLYNAAQVLVALYSFIMSGFTSIVLWMGLEYPTSPSQPPKASTLTLRTLTTIVDNDTKLAVLATALPQLKGSRNIFHYGLWTSRCFVDEEPDKRLLLVHASHFYFITKVVELLDTVFFVLRKKQRQVSFLHVYHHTIMVMATYLITKYSRTDAVLFLGTINSLIHVIMYSYYGLSAFPSLNKYLWWKKYITMMQLIQFSLMFLHVVVSHYVSKCSPSYYLLTSVCFNTVLFLYLFGDFYVKSYRKDSSTRNAVRTTKTEPSINSKNSLNYIINHHKLASKIH